MLLLTNNWRLWKILILWMIADGRKKKLNEYRRNSSFQDHAWKVTVFVCLFAICSRYLSFVSAFVFLKSSFLSLWSPSTLLGFHTKGRSSANGNMVARQVYASWLHVKIQVLFFGNIFKRNSIISIRLGENVRF